MDRTAPQHRRLAWRCLAGRAARAGLSGAAALAAAGVVPGAVAGQVSASTAGTAPVSAAVWPASAAPPLWIHLSAGLRFSCGIRAGNTLWCWGAGGRGELGNGSNANETRPHQITFPTAGWTGVAAGYNHGCAIRTGGDLWCWGDNRFGALGIGPTTTAEVPTPRQITRPAGGGWASVGAGLDDTCAIRADTTLWCWGEDYDGQLGVNRITEIFRPRPVTTPAADGWASIAVGPDHTCAVRTDSTLWCWGDDWAGQLGVGRTSDGHLPEQVSSPATDGWAAVSAGAAHTCAVRTDGTLWCWGWNLLGQLGLGDQPDQELPQQVTAPAADGWSLVEAGGEHTCALRGHALWCWGHNASGQLGIGGTTDQNVPRRVPVPTRRGWGLVTVGDHHTCATRTGHELWCWGENFHGELGLGGRADQHRPQQVTH
jgi:alpha-tubulin suppressor-like RCC1 family protein